MTLRLAVFDMVGTTIEAGDEVPSCFREALSDAGVELSEDDIASIRGRSKKDAITAFLSAHPATSRKAAELLDGTYRRFQQCLRAAYRTRARAAEGAEQAFAALRAVGVEVVLTTGLDRATAELLIHALGWDRVGIAGVVTGDDVARGRPAPDLIHAAMRLAGVSEVEGVMTVGDTTSDLAAAAAAGVGWSIGVLGGAHPRSLLEAHPHSVILDGVAALPGWLVATGLSGEPT